MQDYSNVRQQHNSTSQVRSSQVAGPQSAGPQVVGPQVEGPQVDWSVVGAPGVPKDAGAQVGQLPPTANRGVEISPVAFKVDYLTITLPWDALPAVKFVCSILGIDGDLSNFEKFRGRHLGYRFGLIGPYGVVVLHGPGGDGPVRSTVQMPGDFLGAVHPRQLGMCLHQLVAAKVDFTCSRLDLAFDCDFFGPSDIADLVAAGDLRCPAERQSLREVRERFKVDSYTTYVGSRSSERMGRCYLKAGRTRFELEVKGRRALPVLLDLLARSVDEWSGCAMGHVLDFFDTERVWWVEFKAGAERAHLKVSESASKGVEDVRLWLEHQVGPALALVHECLGDEWLLALIVEGAGKWSGRYRALRREFDIGAYLGEGAL